MVVKTFNVNKKKDLDKFQQRFKKGMGYPVTVRQVQAVYICSMPDADKAKYDQLVKEGRL